ncbi:uncharacterized protein LOC101887616 [Musca domestica]|uniref:Uncharacterized protein LOC101887616 n=1 Tax=Musca domestica TaxID=7370 RepID=A0A1I8MAJ0_MUSDO|nr:uncharacterized protein LOC101887616 [Musca domestica]
MFKKSKNKHITPPSPPTLDEILSDIQVDIDIPTVNNNANHKSPTDAVTNLDSWWQVFEQFMGDLKCLEMVHSELEGCKLKLESQKLEIETEAKLLKNDIDEQRALIKEALE